MTRITTTITGETASRNLRGDIVHHGNRGRSTSSGAGSVHANWLIGTHPHPASFGGEQRDCRPGTLFGYPGLALWRCHVLSLALFTPNSRCGQRRSGQVGSHRFRFCVYVWCALDEGVRHRRTTPGAQFIHSLTIGPAVCVIAGCGSYRRSGQGRPGDMSSFRICGRSATSCEPAIGVPVVVRPAQPTACPSSSPSPLFRSDRVATSLRSRGLHSLIKLSSAVPAR